MRDHACSQQLYSPVTSTKPFSIRGATIEDCAGILECLAAAFAPFGESYTSEGFLDTVLTPESIVKRLQDMTVFVALQSDDGLIVGTISCKAVSGHEGHLRGMAVRPECQGTPIATELLARAERELREAGCTTITLNTTQPLKRAVRFYEKRGFRKTGLIADFFGMPLFQYRKNIH